MTTNNHAQRSAASNEVGCDTKDMVIVHRVFRREFALLPAMITAVAGGDTDRAKTVGDHAREMIEALHHHHEGEDILVWPKLRGHPDIDQALVTRMEEQHARVSELLTDVNARLDTWSRTADAAERDRLANSVAQLQDPLVEHLDDEERLLLPIIARTLTAAEWDAVGDRAMASIPKSRLLVFLGYILEDATPDERTEFLGNHVPLPGRVSYRLIGRRKYEREASTLRRDLAA